MDLPFSLLAMLSKSGVEYLRMQTTLRGIAGGSHAVRMLFYTQLWIITELILPKERQRKLWAAFCIILFSGYSVLNGKISH